MFPFKLGISLIHSLFILLKFKPKFVIGTGGFASGPLLFAASILRIPTLIHEQNALMGRTNRILSKICNKTAISFKTTKYANYLSKNLFVHKSFIFKIFIVFKNWIKAIFINILAK